MTVTNDFRRWWGGLTYADRAPLKLWAKRLGPKKFQTIGECVALDYAVDLYIENPGNQSLDDALPDLMEKVREMVLEVVK